MTNEREIIKRALERMQNITAKEPIGPSNDLCVEALAAVERLEAERQSDTARLISWLRVNMRVRADELGNSASRQEGETFYRMAGGSCLLENVANGLHLWAESMPADYDATKEHAAIDVAIKSTKESANE